MGDAQALVYESDKRAVILRGLPPSTDAETLKGEVVTSLWLTVSYCGPQENTWRLEFATPLEADFAGVELGRIYPPATVAFADVDGQEGVISFLDPLFKDKNEADDLAQKMRLDYGINVRSLLALRDAGSEFERYEGLDEWPKLRDGLVLLREQIAKEQKRVKSERADALRQLLPFAVSDSACIFALQGVSPRGNDATAAVVLRLASLAWSSACGRLPPCQGTVELKCHACPDPLPSILSYGAECAGCNQPVLQLKCSTCGQLHGMAAAGEQAIKIAVEKFNACARDEKRACEALLDDVTADRATDVVLKSTQPAYIAVLPWFEAEPDNACLLAQDVFPYFFRVSLGGANASIAAALSTFAKTDIGAVVASMKLPDESAHSLWDPKTRTRLLVVNACRWGAELAACRSVTCAQKPLKLDGGSIPDFATRRIAMSPSYANMCGAIDREIARGSIIVPAPAQSPYAAVKEKISVGGNPEDLVAKYGAPAINAAKKDLVDAGLAECIEKGKIRLAAPPAPPPLVFPNGDVAADLAQSRAQKKPKFAGVLWRQRDEKGVLRVLVKPKATASLLVSQPYGAPSFAFVKLHRTDRLVINPVKNSPLRAAWAAFAQVVSAAELEENLDLMEFVEGALVQTYGDNGNAWMYCPLLPDASAPEGVVLRYIDAAVKSLPPKLVWEKLLDAGMPKDLGNAVGNLPMTGVLYDKSIVTPPLPPSQSKDAIVLRSGQLTDTLTLKVCRGDITEQLVGTIVNASNMELVLGGGVAGAISAKGGRTIQAQLDAIRAKQLPNVGEGVVTNGGLLPAKWIYHAVGPNCQQGHIPEQHNRELSAAYTNSLKHADTLAAKLNTKSVALPPISTGIFAFPKALGIEIMFACAVAFGAQASNLTEIRFVDLSPVGLDEMVYRFDSLFCGKCALLRQRCKCSGAEHAGATAATLALVQEGPITVLRDGRICRAPNTMHVKVCRGDLALLPGCIVNASNRELVLGSGVAGAIADNGGPAIQAELNRLREKQLPNVGECVVTSGGKLKAKHVIHAVGPECRPVHKPDVHNKQLHSAYTNSLVAAEPLMAALAPKCISFPPISTGVFSFPKELGIKIMFDAVVNFKAKNIEEVRLVDLNPAGLETMTKCFDSLFCTKCGLLRRTGETKCAECGALHRVARCGYVLLRRSNGGRSEKLKQAQALAVAAKKELDNLRPLPASPDPSYQFPPSLHDLLLGGFLSNATTSTNSSSSSTPSSPRAPVAAQLPDEVQKALAAMGVPVNQAKVFEYGASPGLKARYQACTIVFASAHPRYLLHGTSGAAAASILRDGFKLQFAKAGAVGNAIYLTKNWQVAFMYGSKAADGCVIVSEVKLGNPMPGKRGQVVTLDWLNQRGFQSVNYALHSAPNEYAVYNEAQILPMYCLKVGAGAPLGGAAAVSPTPQWQIGPPPKQPPDPKKEAEELKAGWQRVLQQSQTIRDCAKKTISAEEERLVAQPAPSDGEAQLSILRMNLALDAVRKNMPVYAEKDRIMVALKKGSDEDGKDIVRAMLLTAPTGSGKTTVVPQLLCDEVMGMGGKRRVCVLVPTREVAKAMQRQLGSVRAEPNGETDVGYQCGISGGKNSEAMSVKTRLVFATHGFFMASILSSPAESVAARYSAVVIDEAHCRSLESDTVLTLFKHNLAGIVKLFPSFRLIIMSATLDVQRLLSYLGSKIETTHLDLCKNLKPVIAYEYLPVAAPSGALAPVGAAAQLAPNTAQPGKAIANTPGVASGSNNAAPSAPVPGQSPGASPAMPFVEAAAPNVAQPSNGTAASTSAPPPAAATAAALLQAAGSPASPSPPRVVSPAEATAILQTIYDVTYAAVRRAAGVPTPCHILVFVPGVNEAQRGVVDLMQRLTDDLRRRVVVLALYSNVSESTRRQINAIASALAELPTRCPKNCQLPPGLDRGKVNYCTCGAQLRLLRILVVFTTNVAEAGLTIPGVRYVIDSCLERAELPGGNPNGPRTIPVLRISRHSATQRAGRAGRDQYLPGRCLCLLSEQEYEQLPETKPAAVGVAPIEATVAILVSAFDGNMEKVADMPEPPSRLRLDAAKNTLKRLKAVTFADSARPSITEIGRQMMYLPLAPRLARFVLDARDKGARNAAITIAALLSVPVREMPTVPKHLCVPGSDHLSYLKLYREASIGKDAAAVQAFSPELYASVSMVKRFLEQRIDTACPRTPPCTPERISGLCAFCNYRSDKEAKEMEIVREALASAYADQIADAEFDSAKQELTLRTKATDAEGVAAMNSPVSKTVASQSFPAVYDHLMAFGTKVVYFYVTDVTGLVAVAPLRSAAGAQGSGSAGGAHGAASSARFPLLDALLANNPPTHHSQKQALMLRLVHYLLHLPDGLKIYGGFVRDLLLRGEAANDVDILAPSAGSREKIVAAIKSWAAKENLNVRDSQGPRARNLDFGRPGASDIFGADICSADDPLLNGPVDLTCNNMLVSLAGLAKKSEIGSGESKDEILQHILAKKFRVIKPKDAEIQKRIRKMEARAWKELRQGETP